MKYSFRLKKLSVKRVLQDKVSLKSLTLENGNDVNNAITAILMFIELENVVKPVNCSYNFLSSQLIFELELNPAKQKQDFFNAIKQFEDYMDLTKIESNV